MLSLISIAILPFLILIILAQGYVKGIDIYTAFIEGAKEGLKISIRVLPYLIAIHVSIGVFRGSNAMEMFSQIIMPITSFLKIPKDIVPLIIIRPISGSGALGVVKDIIENTGPDSLSGRMASIMMGSSETIFYTLAVYFGSIGVKDYRHTLKAAIISYIFSIIASLLICLWYFG